MHVTRLPEITGTMSSPPPDVEYIVITFWDKIAIACGAAGFLFLALMCMLCILCPENFCCCCYGNSPEDEKRKRFKLASQKSTSSKSSYGSTESDYIYGSPDGGETVLWTPLQVIKEHELTGPVSDWSSDAGSGGHDVIQLDSNKKRIGLLPNGNHGDVSNDWTVTSGKIDFVLSYLWSEQKLLIKVVEVHDVKLSGEHCLVSPYVKIRIYRTPKQLFGFRESIGNNQVMPNMEQELKTKMRRPADVLTYKETFEVSMDAESMKGFTVCFLLCDMDKLSRHVTLGETSVLLRKAKLLDVKEAAFSKEFHEPSKEYLGTVTVGLCYLPTSEKMYVTIESVKDLKAMDRQTGSTDACVKLHLMYDGKQLKRVKTTVRSGTLNPVFNETFSFDIPQSEIEKVYFSLAVCHYNAERKRTKMIGRVYMGLNFDLDAVDQWNSMMQNPRKKIVKTHNIIN